MTSIILTENLTRRFGSFTAVDHLNFAVEEGSVIGYLGPNGSGKTTTIRMLLGLLTPSEGRASVMGYDAATQAEEVRQRSGYMSQKFALYNELTVRENVEFYGGVYGIRDPKRVSDVLGMLELMEQARQRAGSLAAGWRQRLALAIAIVHKPRILFLDEPTSGVDPVARRNFWDLIYQQAEQGVTVLVTTHYMDEAEYCQQVGIMRQGKLLAMDTPLRLKGALALKAWEVEAEPLAGALAALQKLSGVRRAGFDSDRLRALTEPGISPAELKAGLLSAGATVRDIQPVEITLEDVFLSI
jgi:ABC-2 type transport system ATP-binding protein